MSNEPEYLFIISDDEQFELIRELCGGEAAAHANYGWFVEERDTETHICTKVYGHGILTTIRAVNGATIRHEWQPVNERGKYGPNLN